MTKYFIPFTGILFSIVTGFLFAGLIGAFCFSLILTLTLYLKDKLSTKSKSKIRLIAYLIIFFTIGYSLMYVGGLIGANEHVLKKLDLIEQELKKKEYNTNWFIISQKRNRIMNSLLPNSAKGKNPKKESQHISGKAIDIYVLDIDGDNVFNRKDIKILEQANSLVEKNHPELTGAFGDYFLDKHDYFTKHMIHIDTRGQKVRYSI